jgi:CheY-like chemotaxis protein
LSHKILIIDDEEDVRTMLSAILSTKGHEITEARDGVEGMAVMEAVMPDLVICDMMMPKMSGLEVIKRKKRNEQLAPIPIMILSAVGTETHPPEFWMRSLGVDDYIQKPFDPLDILGRVEYLFRRSNYVSTKASAASRRDRDDEQTSFPVDLAELAPQDVVRAFVESWNVQDFATEFGALAEEMTGGLNRHDYVTRRRRCFLDEKADERVQSMEKVLEEKVSLNVAKVVIQRRDRTTAGEDLRRETYTLKKTGNGWKIITVKIG